MNLRLRVVATLPFLLLLGACTEEPKPAAKKEAKPPAEPISALSAAYKMYKQARGWAPDCQILRLANLDVADVKGQEGGKMAAWEAVFVSHTQRQLRRFTYSVAEVPGANIPADVFGGSAETWSPVGQNLSFAIQFFKTDSTEAYTTAMEKAKDYAAKHPDQPVKFVLEWLKRNTDPSWRVYWGESVQKAGLSVYVDATTGKYMSTAH